MAKRTRDFAWEKTLLGPIESWPDLLLATVNTLLASRTPMFLWWGEELIQFYNDAYRPSLGSDKHPKALGQSGRECWPEIWSLISPQIDDVLHAGVSTWHEDQLVPIYRDGVLEDVYWTYSYSPVREPDGTIRAVLVICSETTGRIKAEQRSRKLLAELQESEEHLRLALSAAKGVGTWDWDIPGNRVFVDTAFARTYRVEPSQPAEGAPIEEFTRNMHPEDRSRVEEEIARAVRSGEDYNAEYRLIQADGSVCWVLARGRCTYSQDGTPLRFPGVTLDITEQKRTAAALLQNEKLAAVGRLAGSIAHEINNPLESVTNLLYLAKGTSDLPPQALKYLETAELELRRASAITSQTLRFYKQSTKPSEVSCADLVESSVRLYHSRLVNDHIQVERRDRSDENVKCFEGEIRQVINNLVSNAVDAMEPTGGRLFIRSRSGTDWRTGRRGVYLTVADTGKGMSLEDQQRAFQAFFTTKGFGGTGLGLWISREIIDRHSGFLRLRSSQRTGRSGAIFILFLPYEAGSRENARSNGLI